MICGGEDEEFTDEERRDALIEAKSARIAEKLAQAVPGSRYDAGIRLGRLVRHDHTGLPYIGPVPRHPRIHAVMGYGGNGITYSQIASEIVASAIDGREDCDAGLFAFKR